MTSLIAGVGVLALAVAGFGLGGTPSGPATPTGSPLPATASPPPPLSSPPPVEVPGVDEEDLPRVPGALRTGYEHGVDGAITWTLTRYLVADAPDAVRTHYRRELLERGWFVGDVGFEDERWRFVANRGSREAIVEIAPDVLGTRVTVYVSDLVAPPTVKPPRPTATPTPEPPERTARPKPEPPEPTARPTRRPWPERTQHPDRPERTARPTRAPQPERTPQPPADDDDDDDDDDDADDDDGDDD